MIAIAERFWKKVRRTDDCWEWIGSRNAKGYGSFGIGRKLHGAHRVSWVLAHGQIPDGLWVLHRCDNPSCVRPDHLFLGTPRDNVIDKLEKGRDGSLLGEAHQNAVVSDSVVREIRARYVPHKVTYEMLGREYGMSPQGVGKLVRGERRATA